MQHESNRKEDFLQQPAANMTPINRNPQASERMTTNTITAADTSSENDPDKQSNGSINVATEEDGPPPAEFKVGELVYAADETGVAYEATIRRKLYGIDHQKQVSASMVSSKEEADEILAREEDPSWHYFVHFHGWSVKWDRWSPASKIFAKSEDSKLLASRLQEEHRKLTNELSGKRKGKKTTLSAGAFLAAWNMRKSQIYRAFEERNLETDASTKIMEPVTAIKRLPSVAATVNDARKSPSREIFSAAQVQAELALRNKCLTRIYKHGDLVPLPSTLKKILVDSWENIAQCDSLPDLPARVTVRDALNKYLASKGVEVEGTLKHPSDGDKEADGNSEAMEASDRQQWIDMRDGVCLYFDEALPHQLLYAGELVQLDIICNAWTEAGQPATLYSNVYGCEHLLRLLTKLPALLLDNASETEARSILAKINDFVRFLNKNSSLFSLNYRPYTESELNERKRRAKIAERKRKLVLEIDSGEKLFSATATTL